MDDIAVIADRIIALKDGKIVADGTPKQVFTARQLISDIGLDVPSAAHLADEFISRGIPVAKDVISMDELCRELARIREEKVKNSAGNHAEKSACSNQENTADRGDENGEISLAEHKQDKGVESDV